MPSETVGAVAFSGGCRIAGGPLREVAADIRRFMDREPAAYVLVFDAVTSEPIELDLRGSVADVVSRLMPAAGTRTEPRPPGRPKLGVVAREVTLLPRHWEWLAAQPGGASVTLRRLVEEARREGGPDERLRAARESAYRFATAVAGDLPAYEEAMRALFAGDRERFDLVTDPWPVDVRAHVRELAGRAFAS